MVLSNHDVVEPDLFFVSKERAHVITTQLPGLELAVDRIFG